MRTPFLAFAIALLFLACQSDKKPEAQKSAESGALPSGTIHYLVPQGWVIEQPSSSMRKAQFRWPGVEGEADAEMAVFFFPGTGGSVDANLSRWYTQFKQPDGTLTHAKAKKEKRTVNGIPVTITYVTGTFLKSAAMMTGGPSEELPGYALLAAIAETAEGPWFFKATGPEKTILHWRKSFDEFVNSFTIK